MRSHTAYLTFKTKRRREYVNVTSQMEAAVGRGGVRLKNLLLHHRVILPITDGKLAMGPWQQVYYAEFDGQRSKRVVVKIMGD